MAMTTMKRISKFFFLFLIILITIPACEFSDNRLQRVSLLVANIDDSNSEWERTQDLIRYNFEKGELISTETIVSNPGGQLRFNCDESRVYRNRYVITDFGDIVDLTTRQFIHRGGSGSGYTRLLEVEGDYVYIHQPQAETYYYFDLANLETVDLEDPGSWALPGLLSPDRSKSVTSGGLNGGQIWLHELNGETELLGEGFYVEYSEVSSSFAGVPLLWLDNERILTQQSNGVLVLITIDGSVVPVVNIDLSAFDSAPSGLNGALHASLFRNLSGDIIYSISLLTPEDGFRENRFVIDVETNSYSLYNDPEWITLGHEFEYSPEEDPAVLRYKGKEIGTEEYFIARYVRTTDGHLATISRETSEYPTSIKVWSRASGKWTSMDFEFPVWITYSAVIGWVE
jgi:hypothetical protein